MQITTVWEYNCLKGCNKAKKKMAIKTSGKALKTKVGRVSGNIVGCFLPHCYLLNHYILFSLA
jgi:hypothetical protein